MPESFLIKAPAYNFIKKETLVQVFPCEFCEISKNTFSQNTSCRLLLNEDLDLVIFLHWVVTFYNTNLHFRDFFSLDYDFS